MNTVTWRFTASLLSSFCFTLLLAGCQKPASTNDAMNPPAAGANAATNTSPATDNAAHIGGVTGGFAIAYIAGTPRLTGYGERLWHFGGAAAVALTAVAFAFMFRWMMTAGSL